jgi:hypothetical protein
MELLQIEEPGERGEDLDAGAANLADASAIGIDALAATDAVDIRGASVSDRVALLVTTAARLVIQKIGRPIAGAVVVVPLESTAGLRLALMHAVEAGGVPVLRLVEESVALGYGGGLDRAEDGAYLHLAAVTGGIALARLETAGGAIRLVGGGVATENDALTELIAAEAPVKALLAPGLADAEAIAAAASLPLLDGFDGAERAVIGAALFAEAVG